MTIRLKLTLIYSIIITLILVVFSVILYSTQYWTTMNVARKSLNYHFGKTIEAAASGQAGLLEYKNNNPQIYTQVRSPDGQIIQIPLTGAPLPLSDDGLRAAQQGQSWLETASLDDGQFLIRSEIIEQPAGKRQIIQVALPIEDRFQFLGELRNILIIGDTLVIIIAFGIGWALAGVTLRPIHRITQTAKTVGEKRDFSQRVEHVGPHDEIGQLATTFNNMLTQLEDAYVQIEQSLQAQRRFVADASHELRTPLTTIRGNISLLQRQPPISIEDRADILTDTVEETERLIRLVNDLLVLARADARQPLRSEPIRLQPLLEDVHRQVKLLAPQRSIIYQSQPDLMLEGDSDALKQVLLALLDNALKHTPPQSTITITTATEREHIIINVCDDGPGMNPSQLPQIFNRFYRGDAARSGPGTGLGLAIAHELTQAQHGTLTAQSQVGQGSVFTLTFPKPTKE